MKKALALLLLLFVVTVCSQIFFVFPGAFLSPQDVKTPLGVKVYNVRTEDGENLEVWHQPVQYSRKVVIFFHGNGGPLPLFKPFANYFNSIGYSIYMFDYRGFGNSTGWPSEEGIYADSVAVTDFVKEQEKIEDNKKLLLVGYSLGASPASYMATRTPGAGLLLYAPFYSLYEVASNHPLGFLRTFLWYSFPTGEFVSKSDLSCFIVVHGEKDKIVPEAQGQKVFYAYPGRENKDYIKLQNTHHKNPLEFSRQIVKESLLVNCKSEVKKKEKKEPPEWVKKMLEAQGIDWRTAERPVN